MKKPPLVLKILVPVLSIVLVAWFVAYRVRLVKDRYPTLQQAVTHDTLPVPDTVAHILSSSKSGAIFVETTEDIPAATPQRNAPHRRIPLDETNGSATDRHTSELLEPDPEWERVITSSKSGDIFYPPKEADTPVQNPRTIMGSSKSKAVFEPEPVEAAPNRNAALGSSKSGIIFKPPQKDSAQPRQNPAPNANNPANRPK